MILSVRSLFTVSTTEQHTVSLPLTENKGRDTKNLAIDSGFGPRGYVWHRLLFTFIILHINILVLFIPGSSPNTFEFFQLSKMMPGTE